MNVLKNKAGYVSGERIEFVVRISNNSNREIKPLDIMFFKKMTYYKKHGHYSFKSLIYLLSNDILIEPMQNYEWNDISSSFILPSLRHSSYGSCRIIKTEYFLRLQVSLFGSKRFHLNIPITIGNFIFENFDLNVYLPLRRMIRPTNPSIHSLEKGV